MTIINEVAREAGVSISTVSKALNNKKGVGEFTREKVLNICRQLDYTPPKMENPELLKPTGNIGYIMTRKHGPLFYNPFYLHIISGVEMEVEKNNFNLLFSTLKSGTAYRQKIPDVVKQHKIDGVILAGADIEPALIKKLEEICFPTVLVDNVIESEKIDYVVADNHSGAREAVEFLISRGHREIAFVSGPREHPSFEERFNGYKMALIENNISLEKDLIHTVPISDTMGTEIARKMLNNRKIPRAIFAANDKTALNIMQVFKGNGVNIPRDVSLIGFDDIDIAQYLTPSLTTVAIDKESMGLEACHKLISRLNNPDKTATKTVIPTRLLERNSVRDLN